MGEARGEGRKLSELLVAGLKNSSLSPREQQIVVLAAEGLPDKNIAKQLGLTPGTVRTYWVRLRAKTNTRNRAELMSSVLADAIGGYERERLRLGLELHGLSQAVLVVDRRMCCRGANQAAADLFGHPVEFLLDKGLMELFPDADEMPILMKMRRTIEERQPMAERFRSVLINAMVDMSGHPTDQGGVFVISRVEA
jgi:DNA-binding CsgD family transcriptional regulator